MGWLKNSEVELHECLTSEGLKLGLVRIIGEKYLKKPRVREISLLAGIGRLKKSGV